MTYVHNIILNETHIKVHWSFHLPPLQSHSFKPPPAMDIFLPNTSLNVLDPSARPSKALTSIVHNILIGAMSHVTRENVIGFCKMLLLGDEKMPTTGQKSLAYIAKVQTSTSLGWKVVVTVVKVTDNLKNVLADRSKMFKQVTTALDCVTMVSECLQMMISDPRKYTQGCVLGVLDISDTRQFTYKRKSTDPQPYPGDESKESEVSPKGRKTLIDDDDLEGANLLFGIKISPPRVEEHASPQSRDMPTSSSVMSPASDVMPMTHDGHGEAARILQQFYTTE